MSEQIDIAVDLGAVAPPLPEIGTLRDFVADPPKPPPQIIQGILHQGCKMFLGGTSNTEKEPKDRQKGRSTLLGVGWPSFFCRWTAEVLAHGHHLHAAINTPEIKHL